MVGLWGVTCCERLPKMRGDRQRSRRSEKGLEIGVEESLGGPDWWKAGSGLTGSATGGVDGANR